MSDHDALLGAQNLPFVESLYADFLEEPTSVDPEWRRYFEALGASDVTADEVRPRPPDESSIFGARAAEGGGFDLAVVQDRVDQLVRAFRVRGHMAALLDPLGLPRRGHPELNYRHYGLTPADLERDFSAATLSGPKVLPLKDILSRLEKTYCGHIGVQFMHIDDLRIKSWLQTKMESSQNQLSLSRERQLQVLTKLTDAEAFEQFIHRKFIGAKRFSLEGGESLIPLLHLALEKAGQHGVVEVLIGMAHRGRLNVLANVMGKDPGQIFYEFEDRGAEKKLGGGDVKYHMGYSSDHVTSDGNEIHLSLCFNPSHLEFVGPVLVGRARAKQHRRGDADRGQVLPILIHGDAAFAGQGIVQETLNLSELDGYEVGGTVHIIVNNQIGFTTPPESSRSTPYPSDVAKMLQIPIIHVNGEHPEAVAQAISLAMEFRRNFKKDVVIDMWCYRLHGHNEGDEPAFTQPLMYAAIRRRKTVLEAYRANVLNLGKVTIDEADAIAKDRRKRLDDALKQVKSGAYSSHIDSMRGAWSGFTGGLDKNAPDVETAVPAGTLSRLLRAQGVTPETFSPHPKLARLNEGRIAMANGEQGLDWGAAESLAFATLLAENVDVRLSGQDCGRGTFSHRHAVLHDSNTGDLFVPLNHLTERQGRFEVIDSSLSESGVLGFEFGYSLDMPNQLVIWEAQFGDFANGAQVIIDQFISSSEDKWDRLSGLVMLLPHGFEGQGPEHSSARFERFLTMCAEDNMQICNLSTPAQIFHCLRRQVHRSFRKPLVIMSPKSLLRNPAARSSLADLAEGSFQYVIGDTGPATAKTAKKVVLCTGKVYYDLVAARAEAGLEAEIPLIRVEQLYPLREADLFAAMEPYGASVPVVWVQEEPENMGAWPFLRLKFGERIGPHASTFAGVARAASASPATGSAGAHRIEQADLLARALDIS